MSPVDRERRHVLALLAGAATVTLVPGVTLVSAGEPASADRRWGLLIDVGKCADGCEACVTACREENGWGEADTGWIRAGAVGDGNTTQTVPVLWQQCGNPPSVDVCPTSASFRRADGIVLVDKHRCIGCRYCMMACPFGARSFVDADVSGQRPQVPRGKGTVEACTFCVHRIDAGGQPACVEACGGGMLFGDLNDPDSDISKALDGHLARRLRDDLALGQSVLYRGV